MTNEPIDLDAAQALADAATPGPWRALWHNDGDAELMTTIYGESRRAEAIALTRTDARFIVQARDLVPTLIARVRDAEAKERYADRRNIERGDELVTLRMELKAARATIARVKELADETPAGIYGDYGPPVVLASAIYDALEGENS